MAERGTLDVKTDGGLGVHVRSNFLRCPACGSDDVLLHIAGQNVDSNIECQRCDEKVTIR